MKRLVSLSILILLASLAVGQEQNPAAPAAPTTDKTKTTGPVAEQPPAPADSAPAGDANDSLFGVPPLPKGTVSLVGGTVSKIDRVRDKLTVNVFGKAGKMDVRWDERTHIYRDGTETTERGIQKGDRVYVDTMKDGPKVFARNIRIVTNIGPADARGQLLSFDRRSGTMLVHDDLSGQPVRFRVSDKTAINGRQGAGTVADLVPGALLAVRFAPGKEYHGIAKEVSIIAKPGHTFLFAGKITHLDMRSGVLSIANRTDNRAYDISFDTTLPVAENLQVGSDITVNAAFTGKGYRAQEITLNQPEKAQKE
jgi:hypothetical protein